MPKVFYSLTIILLKNCCSKRSRLKLIKMSFNYNLILNRKS